MFSKCWWGSVFDIKIADKLLEKEEGAGNENFQCFIELFEKMPYVETSISKLRDQIQYFSDTIHFQILNNPENEMLPINLCTKPELELRVRNSWITNQLIFKITSIFHNFFSLKCGNFKITSTNYIWLLICLELNKWG